MMQRVGWYQSYIALQTLVTKEVLRFMRIWSQTLLPSGVTMSLYFIIFGKFLGQQIHHIDGYTYIQYIAPGLIMMSIMTNAYANTVSSFFLAKFNRSIEEMLISPMPSVIILIGYTVGGMLRGILVGCIVTLVALLFTHMPVAHPSLLFIVTVLASMILSLGGLINGIFAKRFDDISFIPTFVLTPLTYLGGVFYSVKQLPPTWHAIAILNPVLDIVDVFRYGFLNISDINIYFGISLISLLLVTVFLLAWILLYYGVGIKA